MGGGGRYTERKMKRLTTRGLIVTVFSLAFLGGAVIAVGAGLPLIPASPSAAINQPSLKHSADGSAVRSEVSRSATASPSQAHAGQPPAGKASPNNGATVTAPRCPATEGASPGFSCQVCPLTAVVRPAWCWPCPRLAPQVIPIRCGPAPPSASRASLYFCSISPRLQVRPAFQLLICGAGFHSRELVMLRGSGPRGSFSWQVRADTAGSFQTVIPTQPCPRGAVSLHADGNQGSHSNTLTMPASCPPRM
jgi:hypothetical protein